MRELKIALNQVDWTARETAEGSARRGWPSTLLAACRGLAAVRNGLQRGVARFHGQIAQRIRHIEDIRNAVHQQRVRGGIKGRQALVGTQEVVRQNIGRQRAREILDLRGRVAHDLDARFPQLQDVPRFEAGSLDPLTIHEHAACRLGGNCLKNVLQEDDTTNDGQHVRLAQLDVGRFVRAETQRSPRIENDTLNLPISVPDSEFHVFCSSGAARCAELY